MKTKVLVFALSLSGVLACSNETLDDMETISVNDISLSKINKTRSATENIICFNSDEEYEKAVKELTAIPDEEKAEWVAKHYGEIYTLHDVFEKAMREAEDLNESIESYETYKNKYKDYLYFAEYKDDCSAYLPVTNKIVAYLLNENGEISIANKIINKKNVVCYSQLQQVGVAMYEETSAPSKKRKIVIKDVKYAGDEEDCGWYVKNGKKIKLKCGRRILQDGGYRTPLDMDLHIEISFRKHVFCGYINYSSRVAMTGTLNCSRFPSTPITVNESKTADSSHDYYYPILRSEAVLHDSYFLRCAPRVDADLTLDYRGIPTPIHYVFTLDETWL